MIIQFKLTHIVLLELRGHGISLIEICDPNINNCCDHTLMAGGLLSSLPSLDCRNVYLPINFGNKIHDRDCNVILISTKS